ncbi:MAG: hypothetical protein ACR2JF_13150 [Iamia sp.]
MDADEPGRRAIIRRDPDAGAEGSVALDEGDPRGQGVDSADPSPEATAPEDAVRLPRRPERTGHGPVGDMLLRLGGPLLIIVGLLVVMVVALVVVLVGSRQPDIVALRDSGTVDTFNRPDGEEIGAAPLLDPWDTEGEWRIVDGTAYLASAPGSGTGFALLPGTVGNGRVAATILGIQGEGGIVARYTGPDDYMSLRPVPEEASWRLDVVAGGEVVATEQFGLVGAPEGSRVELILDGATASVIIGGQLRGESVDVSAGAESGQVGLVAALDDLGGSSRFDDVARERA